MTNKINLKRLERHYAWMAQPVSKLKIDEFFFGEYLTNKSCGTAGCSLGELALANPRYWTTEGNWPTLKENSYSCPLDDAAKWFNIDRTLAEHLFMFGQQKPKLYGGKRLSMKSTKAEVNANLKEVIRRIKAGKLV